MSKILQNRFHEQCQEHEIMNYADPGPATICEEAAW